MKRVLLIVGGGIAAYKSCELVRLLRKRGHAVRCVLTEGASHFVTPMTLAALSEDRVYTSLWDLKDEHEIGHIQLSRQADLVVVAPATADLIARMAGGHADDLATTVLLATDKPVLAVRLQEVFGMVETPRVLGGRLALTLHLLSPAHRPAAVTQDLRSFWAGPYFDVRRDLRGRYPRHVWPDDPLAAAPTRRAKPRGT